MPQYPAAALWTELGKRVGEISRSWLASDRQISWQLSPSPPDEVNTVDSARTSSALSGPACASASAPTASASLITRPARRRSAGGSTAGGGSTVRAATRGDSPLSTALAALQS